MGVKKVKNLEDVKKVGGVEDGEDVDACCDGWIVHSTPAYTTVIVGTTPTTKKTNEHP